MTLTIILCYLALVMVIGGLSHRLLQSTAQDYFLANRSIGPLLLLLSLFGTHMTAFALLGSSAEAYREGVPVFALMASSSALVVPAVFFLVGTRLWALGKRHGYLTQAQFFRDRWQSDGFGLVLFAVLTLFLVPYLLIGVMGGGITLAEITGGSVPQWVGSGLIAAVVLVYVTLGGLRGTAWANAFQTIVFMGLGVLTFAIVVHRLGGLNPAMAEVAAHHPDLLSGGHISRLQLLTYAFVPLSAGMFPHLFMHWLSARSAQSFRLTVVAYPLCIAAVWLPSVVLGVLGAVAIPGLTGPATNSILVKMIELYAPPALAGLLAAGVFAAIMSSLDSQVLSLGTMFTQDIVRHYGYGDRMSERQQVLAGRAFVVLVLVATYLLSLVMNRSIFRLGVWSFTGFSALFPIVLAALFWKRSTRAGAFAALTTVVVLWIGFVLRAWNEPGYTIAGSGILPVALITLASAAAMLLVSLLTRPPDAAHLRRFFPEGTA